MFKHIRVILVSFIILVLLFAGGTFLRNNYVAPIVMYHSVTLEPERGNMLAVSMGTFRKQMHFLRQHRYNVITLQELGDLVAGRKKIPPKTIAITLDDGYKDTFTHAFPILKEYGLPATVFIIVNEVGRSDRLSWNEIKTMQDTGLISFGSHTLGPDPLFKAKNEEELKKQIFDSKKVLQERLGREVSTFSYPEGMFNDRIRKLVIEAGYRLAVATNPGKKFSNRDAFVLKRLRISENAANTFVFWVETSGYYNFLREHRHKK